jgi:integrase
VPDVERQVSSFFTAGRPPTAAGLAPGTPLLASWLAVSAHRSAHSPVWTLPLPAMTPTCGLDAWDCRTGGVAGDRAQAPPLSVSDPSNPHTHCMGPKHDEVVPEYLDFKRAKGKRTVAEDEAKLSRFKVFFGADTPIADVTAQRIASYERDRITQASKRGATITPSTVNRELAALRHLLHLAEEWGYIEKAPRIRLSPEPQGRIRWLEPDEEARLLAACGRSRSRELAGIVTVALETGMRLGEIMGLTWDRVDLSRGVIRLELTKSGRRREIPMKQAAYNVLAALQGPREGRVWRVRLVRTAFENAVAEAKLDDVHFHDLRPHFPSWFVMRGGNLQALQKLLGHATLAMTQRYAHLSPDYSEPKSPRRRSPPRSPPRSAHGQPIAR